MRHGHSLMTRPRRLYRRRQPRNVRQRPFCGLCGGPAITPQLGIHRRTFTPQHASHEPVEGGQHPAMSRDRGGWHVIADHCKNSLAGSSSPSSAAALTFDRSTGVAARDDNRRTDNGTLAHVMVSNAMGAPVSSNWKGYWQRAM